MPKYLKLNKNNSGLLKNVQKMSLLGLRPALPHIRPL